MATTSVVLLRAVEFCNTCAPNLDTLFTENLSHILRIFSGMELALNRPDRGSYAVLRQTIQETAMQWTTPAYTDLRFGFEITMYIANR